MGVVVVVGEVGDELVEVHDLDLELGLLKKEVIVEVVDGRLGVVALLVQLVAGLLVRLALHPNRYDASVLDELVVQVLLQIRIVLATRQVADLDHTERIVELGRHLRLMLLLLLLMLLGLMLLLLLMIVHWKDRRRFV